MAVATKPKRIQLRRTKGWRMPANSVKVDRSTRWGNPFRPGEPAVVRVFDMIELQINHIPYLEANILLTLQVGDSADCLRLFRIYSLARAYHLSIGDTDPWKELRGKNLACWCPLGKPCHADVLLEIANAEASP
jgi:hypothetical protein